jgi:very-short-patch-repair endonuclease
MAEHGRDSERIWARTDRTIVSPQQTFARAMRKAPTDAERKLWWHLRHRLRLDKTHFRRQVRIGPYIADFACHRTKLVVEIDGGQHATQTAEDEKRTKRLTLEGYRVLRFWNNEVLSNIDGVLTEIQNVTTMTPTPAPSPQGGGEKK